MTFLKYSLLMTLVCIASTTAIGGFLLRMNLVDFHWATVLAQSVSLTMAVIALMGAHKLGFPALRFWGNRLQFPQVSWHWLLACIAFKILLVEAYAGWALSSGISTQSDVPAILGSARATLDIVILTIIGAVFIAPLLEEIVFRGLLMASLAERWGAWVAVFANSMLFGFVHLRPGWTIYLVLAGIVSSVIAMRSNCLWLAILVHAVTNLIALTRAGGDQNDRWLFASYASEANSELFVVGCAILFGAAVYSAWRVSSPSRNMECHSGHN